jgi:hypothetical protein
MQKVTQVGIISTGTANNGQKTWSGWLPRASDGMTQHAPFFGDLSAALGIAVCWRLAGGDRHSRHREQARNEKTPQSSKHKFELLPARLQISLIWITAPRIAVALNPCGFKSQIPRAERQDPCNRLIFLKEVTMAQEIKKQETTGNVTLYRDPFSQMRDEMDRVFDSFLGRSLFGRPSALSRLAARHAHPPAANMIEVDLHQPIRANFIRYKPGF